MCIAFAIAVVVVIKENGEELDGSQEGRIPIALTQIDKHKKERQQRLLYVKALVTIYSVLI